MSQRQLEIVEEGNFTVLIQHLGQRQQLWNEFELLEQQLAPHKGISPERREWKSTKERQMTEEGLNRCKELLDEIMANDQTSLEKTAAQKADVAEQLRRIRQGGKIAGVYGRQSQPLTGE